MTPADFRRLALSLPGVSEASHMGTVDFRVAGKIFATLGYPDAAWGMVTLTPMEHETLVLAEPGTFRSVPGSWRRHGSTNVRLVSVDEATLRSALELAWRHKAPRRIKSQLQPEPEP